jgi:thioredoxin 1
MSEDAIEDIRQRKRERLRAAAAEPETPAEPVPVTGAAEFRAAVGDHHVVLADFYADWCGPCQMLEPVVERLAAETDAAVAKVDVDANQPLAGEYGVRGVPTLVLFVDGEEADRYVGVQDESTLRAAVEAHTG